MALHEIDTIGSQQTERYLAPGLSVEPVLRVHRRRGSTTTEQTELHMMATFWIILLHVVWVGVVVIFGFLTLLMFAFADSPGAGKAAQRMLAPIFFLTIAIFGLSGWLLMHGTWWSVLCSFGLAITPPFCVFAGYNLLMK